MKGQESFHASRKGRCKGCGAFYFAGWNIWSPGKGQGAFHIRCQPTVRTRKATPEEIEAVKQRSQLRKQGHYST